MSIGDRPPPIAFALDHATQLSQTTQMVGAIVLVDGKKSALFLSNLLASDADDSGTAEGVAKRLLEGIVQFVPLPSLAEQCTSMAADGAIIKKGVPAAFRTVLGFMNPLVAAWLIGYWDGMHMLNLVIGDVRTDKVGTIALREVGWMKTVAQDASSLLSGLTMGSGLEELKRVATEHRVILLSPKRFCECRMVQSEVAVYRAMLQNFPALAEYYIKHSTAEVGKKRTKAQEEAHEKARTADSAPTLTHSSGSLASCAS